MRVLLDANIYISYLLLPGRTLIHAAVRGAYILLLPDTLLREFTTRIGTKPFLNQRITQEELAAFVDIIQAVGEVVPTITDPVPAVTRDPKDDYLLAYAVVSRADYLVTGDLDLLVLQKAGAVTILNPQTFAQILAGAE